nr:uncharacterized transmembrane protein DDB_G0289901-like [Solanum lycopersicum]
MTNMKMWSKSTRPSIEPPEITPMPRRPRKKKTKDSDEPNKKKFWKDYKEGEKMKCSLCKNFGHNKKGCPIAKNGYTTGGGYTGDATATSIGVSGGVTGGARGDSNGATGDNGGATTSATSTGVTGGSGGTTTKRPATTSTAYEGATTATTTASRSANVA